MVREPIVGVRPPDNDDDDFDQSLRPQRMRDMVGQTEVCERLRIAVEAALKRGEALGHVLQPGDHALVMSNGGFGGIHAKLLSRLAARETPS